MPKPWKDDLPFPSMFGNNGNMLRAEMRITEVVHRYREDRTTVLHMAHMERSPSHYGIPGGMALRNSMDAHEDDAAASCGTRRGESAEEPAVQP